MVALRAAMRGLRLNSGLFVRCSCFDLRSHHIMHSACVSIQLCGKMACVFVFGHIVRDRLEP